MAVKLSLVELSYGMARFGSQGEFWNGKVSFGSLWPVWVRQSSQVKFGRVELWNGTFRQPRSFELGLVFARPGTERWRIASYGSLGNVCHATVE